MAGASTNPDPEVFAYAAAQVKKALDVTQQLGGENYVLWGGREGYETLLNTDMKRELDQMGRFMNLVCEYKHKIGFKGPLLIEPKPREPTKHQYDYDSGNVIAFLQKYGLSPDDFKLNIENNHATLAGHTFEHEVAYAFANGYFGSIDMNRGDLLLGWDTDQFPNEVGEMALVLRHIVAGRRLHDRRLQLRRQGAPPEHRPGRPVPRPHRRHGRAGPRPAHRRQDGRGRQAPGRHRRPLPGLDRAASARRSWTRSSTSPASPTACSRATSIPSRARASRSCSRISSTATSSSELSFHRGARSITG